MFFKKKEKSGVIADSWVENEIKLAINRESQGRSVEDNLIKLCYQTASEAYYSLLGKGHSGMSMSLVKTILNRLIDRKPLTPITEDDFENIMSFSVDLEGNHKIRCNRYSGLIKKVSLKGETTYCDINRVVLVDRNGFECSSSGRISKIVDDMFPITLPYYPGSVYKIHTAEFTYNNENGNVSIDPGVYNAIYLSHIVTPDKKLIDLDTFIFETPGTLVVDPNSLKLKLKDELINNGLPVEVVKS